MSVDATDGLPQVGEPVGPVTFVPSLMRLVMYAAAMWEFQRIHFDPDWAQREGLEAPIAHGPLLGTYLEMAVRGWAGPGAALRELRWRNRDVAIVDRPVTVAGRVASVETRDGIANVAYDLSLRGHDGTTLLSGHAAVTLEAV